MRLATIATILALAAPAAATVTTSTYSVSYSPAAPTSTFVVTYPFVAKDDLVVTKILEATSTETTLTRVTDYNVFLPIGSTNGYITTTIPVTSDYTIEIVRYTPTTQTTSFTTQGTYSPRNTELALDKLTMIAQETRAAAGTSGDTAVATHVAAADPHTQYALLAGRSGGQTLNGGTAASNNLALRSTSNATKGKILMGSAGTELVVDDANNRVGIGTATPSTTLHVGGIGDLLVDAYAWIPALYGSAASGGPLVLASTSHATKGNILFGAGGESVFDDVNNRLGLGDATPDYVLDVVGDAAFGGSTVPVIGHVGTLYIDQYGGMYQGVDTGLAVISGSDNGAAVGTATAGIHIFGSANVANPNEMWLYAKELKLYDEDGPGGGYDPLEITNSTVAFNGRNLLGARWEIEDGGAAYSLTAAHCGAVIITATDNAIITLPDVDASLIGCCVTVINTGADGAALVSVQPHSTDAIFGSCAGITGPGAATVVQFTGTNNKAINNTKTTANKGDYWTGVATASTGWYTTGCIGEWVSTP